MLDAGVHDTGLQHAFFDRRSDSSGAAHGVGLERAAGAGALVMSVKSLFYE